MLNKVILGGRLTDNATYKQTPNGTAVATFTVAVNRKYTANGEKKADFINCVAWRNTADFVNNYFGKGQGIIVVGSLQQRSYEDKNGQKRIVYEVVADEVSFAGSKQENQKQEDRGGLTVPKSKGFDLSQGWDDFEEVDSDLPF